MVRSEARIPTPSADRYAKQLTDHATHMGARSEWAPPHGVVEFPQGGMCHVTAGPELVLMAEAAKPPASWPRFRPSSLATWNDSAADTA